MKHIIFASLIAVVGCKKTHEAPTASGSAAGSSVGSASNAGSSTTPAAPDVGSAAQANGSAAVQQTGDQSFDDSLELPQQPKRDKKDQAVVDAAVEALRSALKQAKTATTAAEVCKVLAQLNEPMLKLNSVPAQGDVDAEAYRNVRDGLLQTFDALPSFCDEPKDATVPALKELLSDMRGEFVKLISTKP